MRIGLHVSAAGGADKTIERAKELKCETFQFFSRSPQGGPAPVLTKEIISRFQTGLKKADLVDPIIHTPYFINLCSTNERIKKGSIKIIREELERATKLGVPFVVTHLAASKDLDQITALHEVARGIKKILTGYKGSATLLLENAAGAGTVIGSTFEELAVLMKAAPNKKKVGVCIDTCHLFASGYDIRDAKTVQKTLKKFDRIIGKKYLRYIHANDSRTGLGEKKDRHEHVGEGYIGIAGFKALLRHPMLQDIPITLETNHDGKHITDLKKLKSYRP
ncbi:MAG: endonuclease [Candidatus Kerfeldbacteria bacterium CG08_land_8_20_14_0_20_42_7]|uniref:Probable endonuclease 4 n=1 Tax=Candidatus Kerfeldbacteria bacterium CG08_land_8_20_14_0_20_42_7 TaxID=2014245 RepID=A0A2H0YUN8_9BACT|nr:MAG: endonuclease [Candidatus Kerfeldbacteria bacterium CG08_land_8_20_14_0_20_42_7]